MPSLIITNMQSTATILLLVLVGAFAFPTKDETTLEEFKQKYGPLKVSPSGRDVSGRVIGGQEATPHSRPYEGFIGFKAGEGGWLCGGTLISHYFVLTAGHCIDEADSAQVWLGAHNVDSQENGRIIYDSEYLKIHDEYYTYWYDIGLIKLAQYVTYTSTIGPASLPTDSNAVYVGDTVYITGWGDTALNSGSSSVLMEAQVTVLSHDECLKYTYAETYEICTSFENNKSACSGDSGSPLIEGETVIGICSTGTLNCNGGPSVYTNVAHFLDWVKANSDV